MTTITEILKSQGVFQYGVTALQRPLSLDIYRNWLEEGKHAEMQYLKEHLALKAEPERLAEHLNEKQIKKLKTALVIAQDYFPHPHSQKIFKQLPLALYAQGEDYHFWFKEKLDKIAENLKEHFPEENFLVFTDSGPILERDLAAQAGIGWVGKNTCLIHPKKGSLFFIGEILTSLDLPTNSKPIPDFCGNCTRCLEACPTQAITKAKEVDARLCISYWTIESRQIAPENLRKKFQDCFFGCDICQTLCPWNEKIFKFSKNIEILSKTNVHNKTETSNEQDLIEDLRFLLTASGKQIEKRIFGTALKRAGPFGLRRNALIFIANKKLSRLKPEVEKWSKDPKLGELANWTLQEISTEKI